MFFGGMSKALILIFRVLPLNFHLDLSATLVQQKWEITFSSNNTRSCCATPRFFSFHVKRNLGKSSRSREVNTTGSGFGRTLKGGRFVSETSEGRSTLEDDSISHQKVT